MVCKRIIIVHISSNIFFNRITEETSSNRINTSYTNIVYITKDYIIHNDISVSTAEVVCDTIITNDHNILNDSIEDNQCLPVSFCLMSSKQMKL